MAIAVWIHYNERVKDLSTAFQEVDMTRYRIEQALVSAFGVLLGLALAMLIVPGDVGLWVVIAILLAVFCRRSSSGGCTVNCSGLLHTTMRKRRIRP